MPSYRRIFPETRAKWSPTYSGVYRGDICPSHTSYGWIACLFTFYPLLLYIYTLCKVLGVCVPDWCALLEVPMCGISWLRRDTSHGWIVCLFTLWTLTLYACSSYAVGYPKSTGWTWCSVTYIYPYTLQVGNRDCCLSLIHLWGCLFNGLHSIIMEPYSLHLCHLCCHFLF
jgi:hypothetical protein